MSVEDPNAGLNGALGCTNCGGLGHSIANCPKLEENQRRTVAGHVSDRFFRLRLILILRCQQMGARDTGGY